jgi:hypothetical protein
MTASSTPNPESFQRLLADAFVVEESGITTESLSAIVELQHSIAKGELDVDGALRLICERARTVSNATGIAIGLLQGDRLVYRSGSGSATTYVGRHVMATLCVSARNAASGEILRVENAQTDPRIEAAICRQFGANSLVILPIYDHRRLAGVLEVHFREAHLFQDQEVRTYRIMAGLVGEAVGDAALLKHTSAIPAQLPAIREGVEQIAPREQQSLTDCGSASQAASNVAIPPDCGATVAATTELSSRQETYAEPAIMQRVKPVPLYIPRWKALVAVAALLLLTSWIAYRGRRPASPLGASTSQEPSAAEQQLPFGPVKRLSPNSSSKQPTSPVPTEERRRVARTTPHWVRVGSNELDYVAEEVTVRYYTPKPASLQARVGNSRVKYIGDDVTVRYFTPKQAAALPRPVRSTAQQLDR